MIKYCLCCKEYKSIRAKGLCKSCYRKDYYKTNRDKYKKCYLKYYRENIDDIKNRNHNLYKIKKDHILGLSKLYREENKEKIKIKKQLYYKNNKENIKKNNKNNYIKNKDKYNKHHNLYLSEKRKNNIQWKLRHILSSRIRTVLKNNKSKSSISLLGAPIAQVRKHIEERWQAGMTWENHTLKGWHIDHIIPCASFDLSDPEQQEKCFHYTNLQPLWWRDNLEKGANIDWKQDNIEKGTSCEIQTFI